MAPSPGFRRQAPYLLDMLLLFVVAALLIWPLFTTGYLDKWGSIESSFIAEVRFISEHFPPPKWQPLYYLGTRFDYIYAMGLRLGPAVLVRAFGLEPAHAYHLYSAFFYCLGISGAYFLALVISGSRKMAWFTGLGFALTSPCFLVAHQLRGDTEFWEPIRLGVLVRYGEGPHSSSITCLVFALAFGWLAIRDGKWRHFVLAAFASALTVWHNFYGATALAILYPLMAWSLCVTHGRKAVCLRALALPAAAYGLLAFWLTPSYMKITRRNVQYIADQPNEWSRWLAGALVLIFLALSWRLGRNRPERAVVLFLLGSLAFLVLEVAGYYRLGFVVFGNPHRHAPELDFILLLAIGEAMRRLWLMPHRRLVAQVATAVVLIVMLLPAQKYARKSWKLFRAEDYHQRVEYELQDWVRRNMPNARAHVSGSVRFWYLAWSDRAQVEGSQDPGILNDSFMPAHWEIQMGPDGEVSKQWLQVLGADLIIVNDKSSRELFHDHVHPEKFKGLLPVLYDNGRGDVIYGVPRRFPALGRVVDRNKLEALGPVAGNGTRETLAPYVDVLEHGPNAPVETRWEGFETLHISAPVGPGQSILVQESYDDAWRAYSGEMRLPVKRTIFGFVLIDVPPGVHHVRLVFATPLENVVGRWISIATLLVFIGWTFFSKRIAPSR